MVSRALTLMLPGERKSARKHVDSWHASKPRRLLLSDSCADAPKVLMSALRVRPISTTVATT